MSWNYRVVRRKEFVSKDNEEEFYAIHEVYYDNEEANPTDVTINPVPLQASSIEDLQWMLGKVTEALSKPVLEFRDFE